MKEEEVVLLLPPWSVDPAPWSQAPPPPLGCRAEMNGASAQIISSKTSWEVALTTKKSSGKHLGLLSLEWSQQ